MRKPRELADESASEKAATGRRTPEGGEGTLRVTDPRSEPHQARRSTSRSRSSSRITLVQGVLTVLVLSYCLVSVLNARATYDAHTQQFVYRDDYIRWLPHTYDTHSTWFAFWNYLALALSFWAIRDWLLGGKREEGGSRRSEGMGLAGEKAGERESGKAGLESGDGVRRPVSALSRRPVAAASRGWMRLPTRWQRLFWVLCLNGALLGVVCLIQRIDGGSKLLWLVEPRINKDAASQFGPYAYRSNAAQYFNLLWPACLGFWWMLHRAKTDSRSQRGESGPRAYGIILPFVLLMAACAIASLSRGGALVAIGEMIGVSVILVLARPERGQFWRAGLGVAGFCLLALFLSGFLDWSTLFQRFAGAKDDPTSGRTDIYRNALVMAKDFWLWGCGPKTFSPLYRLYFSGGDEDWVAQVHCDWLETWISFGSIGFSLILLMLLSVFCRYFYPGKVLVPLPFAALLWVGLIGCLAFAVADFPFQITSILFLFVLLCAMAASVSRR